jgi:hypothetical protein
VSEDYSNGEWVARTPLGKRYPELTQVMILALKRLPKAECDQLWAEAVARYRAGEEPAPRLTGGVVPKALRSAKRP